MPGFIPALASSKIVTPAILTRGMLCKDQTVTKKAKVTIRDNTSENRYEALGEFGAVAGFAEYQKASGLITFTHTEVVAEFEGQGVGSSLVRGALADVRATGLTVRTRCDFVKGYIEKHPEYHDLVTGN